MALKNVVIMGAGGLFGSHVLAALQKEVFNLSILIRKSSKSTFAPGIPVITVDDDYAIDQIADASRGQHALVSTMPGRPCSVHLRIIDAAARAGVKRFIPTEYGNNTSVEAAELVSLYGDKAKVIHHLRSIENTGLTWTAIHTGQFFDWGLEDGWLDFYLDKKTATIYDSGNTPWSTTTIGTAATTVAKVLLKPTETANRHVHVASFTVSQRQVLEALESATGVAWQTNTVKSYDALKRAADMGNQDYSDGLKLQILMLMYADDKDRGGNFESKGWLCNDLLGLPTETLSEVIGQVVRK